MRQFLEMHWIFFGLLRLVGRLIQLGLDTYVERFVLFCFGQSPCVLLDGCR
jgi:hypothetical protein